MVFLTLERRIDTKVQRLSPLNSSKN